MVRVRVRFTSGSQLASSTGKSCTVQARARVRVGGRLRVRLELGLG